MSNDSTVGLGSRHPKERVFGLDLLRAMAISTVVICHVILLFPLRDYVGEIRANFLGFFGVELFFILSGFLIGQILIRDFTRNKSLSSLWRFLVRRWFRTLPNYFLFFLVCYFCIAYINVDSSQNWKYLLFLQNFSTPSSNFYSISWSLAIEEWFYLLFSAFALLTMAIFGSRAGMIIAIVSTILAVTALRWDFVVGQNPDWENQIRKVVIYRLDAIIIGVLAAFLKVEFTERWSKHRTPLLVLGLLIFSYVAWSYLYIDLNKSEFARIFLFSLNSISMALWLPFFDSWQSASGRVADGVRNLSLWSYALYLTHGVLLDKIVFRRDLLLPLDKTTLTLIIVGYVVCSVWAAAVIYKHFERPFMALREKLS